MRWSAGFAGRVPQALKHIIGPTADDREGVGGKLRIAPQ
jgi:hypothetical protein